MPGRSTSVSARVRVTTTKKLKGLKTRRFEGCLSVDGGPRHLRAGPRRLACHCGALRRDYGCFRRDDIAIWRRQRQTQGRPRLLADRRLWRITPRDGVIPSAQYYRRTALRRTRAGLASTSSRFPPRHGPLPGGAPSRRGALAADDRTGDPSSAFGRRAVASAIRPLGGSKWLSGFWSGAAEAEEGLSAEDLMSGGFTSRAWAVDRVCRCRARLARSSAARWACSTVIPPPAGRRTAGAAMASA